MPSYTNGYLFPTGNPTWESVVFPSSSPASETFKNRRYVAVETKFDSSTLIPCIHDCEIVMDGETFLVSGYYDNARGPNEALKKVSETLQWRGEISVLFVGKTIPFRKQCNTRNAMKAVARLVFLRDICRL
jgi:hypothetical protein